MRSAFIAAAVGAALAVAWFVYSGALAVPDDTQAGGAAPPERIVLIVIDTLRRDHLSIYGAPFATPNIDGLAKQGQAFPNAFASFHQTTMSMASLFTGRTPSLEAQGSAESLGWNGFNWCGMRRFASGIAACIPESLPTLAAALRDAGYWTAAVATNSLMFRPAGYDRGFDAWSELGERRAPADRNASRTHAAATALLDTRPSDHFFLYVHYMDVHDYEIRPPRAGYRRAVQRVDAAVGELLALLDSRGLKEGTTFVLVSDHGERLGGRHIVKGRSSHYGNPSFEEHLAIPLIVSPPHFSDVSGVVRSDGVNGLIRSIAGAAIAPPGDLEPDELATFERRYQTYRRGRWKLFRERETGQTHLVDLESDPGETRDVSAAHVDVVARLAKRLDALAEATSSQSVEPSELTEEDIRRLRELGYVE